MMVIMFFFVLFLQAEILQSAQALSYTTAKADEVIFYFYFIFPSLKKYSTHLFWEEIL